MSWDTRNRASESGERSAFDMELAWLILKRTLTHWCFFTVLLAGLGLTGFYAAKSLPVYRSEAILLYQDRGGSNPLAPQRDALPPRRLGVALQEMLFSHALLQKLIEEFALYPKTVARLGLVGAIDEMQKRDLRWSAREGYVFRISFDSTAPDLAQRVTARAAELLSRTYTDARVQEVKDLEVFLEEEKARAENELRGRESELALFMAKHPEVDANLARAGVAEFESADSGAASLGLEMQALQLRERLTRLQQAASSSTPVTRPAVQRDWSEAHARAEAELAAAQHELAEKRTQFTDEYPDVRRAAMRVESAKARLRHLEESASALATPATRATSAPAVDPSEMRLLQQQLDLVEKQARATRSRTRRDRGRSASAVEPAALARAQAEYTDLERRARESRQRLGLLESRQFQAAMQSVFATQSNRDELVLVDPAFRPTAPIRSARFKILVLGSAFTLSLALALALALAWRNDRLRHPVDVRRFGLPELLCEVPKP